MIMALENDAGALGDNDPPIPARPMEEYGREVYRAKGLVAVARLLRDIEPDNNGDLIDLDIDAASEMLLDEAVALLTRVGDGLSTAQEAEDKPGLFKTSDFAEDHPRRMQS
jgi:hypothetical protein